MMSPDEYLKSITPPLRRLALNPLAADLRYLRDKGCSIRQLTEYARAQGVAVHQATVARFMSTLDSNAGASGSALPNQEVGKPIDETAPALPGSARTLTLPDAEVLPPQSPKPFAFRETDGEIARSVMVRLRSKDSGHDKADRLA